MKKTPMNSRNIRKFSLLLSIATIFAATFVMLQLLSAPAVIETVYAGSTLTPTPEPPPPTNTPEPLPTNTPVPEAAHINHPTDLPAQAAIDEVCITQITTIKPATLP